MNENSPSRALLASDSAREWGALACALIGGIYLIHIGYGDLIPLLWFAWALR